MHPALVRRVQWLEPLQQEPAPEPEPEPEPVQELEMERRPGVELELQQVRPSPWLQQYTLLHCPAACHDRQPHAPRCPAADRTQPHRPAPRPTLHTCISHCTFTDAEAKSLRVLVDSSTSEAIILDQRRETK
eukprot:COSAG06_NODE_2179_length_7405_cov_69.786614_7_plen_132_part_00